MIAKNEESRIARAIGSVREIVGEMIVVDTGSTDRTKDVARDLGARILDWPFTGDFSAARNAGLAACRGEWTLVLDADEFFPISPKGMIETAVAADIAGSPNPYKGYYLLRQNFEENPANLTYSDHVLRLFRNDLLVRYRHRVHETIEESLDRLSGRYGQLTTIPISHYLFERETVYLAAKRRLYLDGLLKDIEEDPADAGRYDFLGCEYAKTGNLAGAERAFRKFLDLRPMDAGGIESLAAVLSLMGRTREAEELLKPIKNI